jgi:hypothetical protein
MVLIKTIHNKGANIVVEAHGEVLFMPGGQVNGWTRRFSNRAQKFAAGYAPVNKRPRWGHYGKPLKGTFTSSPPRFRNYASGPRVYAAVGSSSPHAYYVDQGTGIYNGSGPYQAKILPPWTPGDSSLYEHTWRPGGGKGSQQVKPVMIKGQKGQGFLDKGLKRAFQSMRMRSFQVPADPRISQAMDAFPAGLENFFGNTPANPAFMKSLQQWRAWRDAAWARSQKLNRSPYNSRAALEASIRETAAAGVRRQLAKQAAMSKAQRDLAAIKAAADRRAKAQKKKLLAEKKAREEGRKQREEQRRITRLNTAKLLATAAARKLANGNYTKVFIRPVKNKYGTELVGYDVHYTDASGETHVKQFR